MKNSLFYRRNFLKGFLATITCMIYGKNYLWGTSSKPNQTAYIDTLSACILNQGNLIPPLPKKSLDLTSSLSELEKKLNSKINNQIGNIVHLQEKIDTKILRAISNDFLEGKMVNVDQWYISETEYYALSYLSRVS